ncbi:hypothetical protein G3T38_11865 [Nocardioides zeae]|uniref:Uncharacterized protein n=2 Tax=Nocardioides zeae TaxID=1457234 RepID=A0A6P0HJT5_9ACTN|nr:hypothetical protein [Nocardioides zeae]
MATLLALFGPSPLVAAVEGGLARALERAIDSHDDVPALVQALAVCLRLPPVVPPAVSSSLVVHRRGTHGVARAVDVAVRTGGGASAADLGDGWIAHRPGGAADAGLLAHLASVAAARADVVLLERGAGVSRVELHRGGRLVETRTADGWWRSDEVGPAGGANHPGAVLDLASALGVPARAHGLLAAPAAEFDEIRGATSPARLLGAILASGRWRRPRPPFSPRAGSARR